MNIDLTYWYLFPVGLVIATLAMSAGISGANFWIPVYLICVKLDPLVTFWLALITMIFGFGSGVVRNIHQGTVNRYLVRQYLIPTIPVLLSAPCLPPMSMAKSWYLFLVPSYSYTEASC